MSPVPSPRSRRRDVLAASVVVAALAAFLGLRLLAGARLPEASTGKPVAPRASLPAPKAVSLAALTVPCWACPEAEKWPIAFRTDLDLLAPLGNGTANAGVFFKDFAKPGGSRYAEATALMDRRVDGPPDLGKVLPPDDPLLLEAEPWCDQATMRYYPDFFPLEGYATQLPNLLVPLTFAKSWVARGRAEGDPARAMADFRRAIRIGRLLRQEGATVIADLVGLACIRHGAQGIYDRSRERGDVPLALVASNVLGECAPQRLLTSERITKVELRPFVREEKGELVLSLPGSRLDAIVALATDNPDVRFRGEGIITLGMVRVLGTSAQQERAIATLKTLSTSKDARIATLATWSLGNRPTTEAIREALAPLPR